MEKGKLIVVSGFSGVGKGTVIKKLMEMELKSQTLLITKMVMVGLC